MASLGAGSLIAKIDVESAYRLVPVHPDDRPLLGIEWAGQTYCDAMLPFGLRSSAKIFTALADALEWTVRQRGVPHIAHFVVVGPPHSSQCADSLQVLTDACKVLGVPLATGKCEGPTTCLTFLGIELDTVAWSLRLPADKLSRIKATLQEWSDRKACRRRELESLVGLLQHACKVVKPRQYRPLGIGPAYAYAISGGATRRSKHTHPQIRGVSRWPVTLPPKVEMYMPGEPQHTHRPHAQRASTLICCICITTAFQLAV